MEAVRPTPRIDLSEQEGRIELPGLTDEERERVSAIRQIVEDGIVAHEHMRSEQKGLVAAMLRLGKPIAKRTPKKAKKSPVTAYRAKMKARSAYLKG